VALIQAGVVDNSRKGVDMGVSVANTLCGTREAYRFAHRNAAIEVRHTRFTHSAQALALLQRLHAVNGALEVDLSGQVNCETLGSRPRGGIGGLLDFARAARVSDGGRGITVLASTASGGRVSRIVPQLSGPATLGRADVDAVVTEHGVAHLRDMSLAERARRLIAVAAPQHRETLLAQLHTMTQGAA
jgi:acyl-CoA hydrolase